MNDAFLVKFFETFITTQAPITMSTCPNSSVSFSLIASGVGLSYQWQSKSPSGTQFSNILSGGINNFSGVTTTSLSIGNPSGLDGYEFRCIVSNSLSSEISTTTVLTVYTIPTIQSQPISSTMCSGVSATFILGATGSGLTYQWQYGVNTSSFINLINGGTNSISGSNSSALVIGNTSGLSNYYFRCIVGSSLCPSTATSNFAQLTVINIPTIVTQPASVTVCPNQIANLTLSASGTGLTYQWQNRMGSSGSWVNCSNGAIYSGSTANTLQILNLTGLNNYQYRCVVTNSNACSATSNAVLLTVYTTPSAIITADGGSANPVTINFGDASALLLSGSINSANPNILWTPAVGLSSTTVADPIAYPTNSTNYTVTFTNTNGCTQTVSQQVNVNPLPNNGTISVVSATGLNSFNLFDTLKVEVRLIGASDIYAAYARLRYSGALASNLTYVGYTTGTILGTGAAVISTPPVSSGTYGYDFGISKIGAVPGYSGTGTLYTFFFKPNNIPSSLSGSQVCFFVDNLSITNATSGTPVGLVNQGPSCFNYSSQINVWPGDLDNNKTVNTSDLLKIGIFYNNTGPIRPNANLQWVAQPASLWGFNTSSPNSDAFKVFADGNGDGIINNADQTSVGFNIGKIHPFVSPLDSLDGSGFQRISATGNLTLIPTPGYVNTSQLPQQVELQVNLTNTGGTLDNLYGISFDITVDTNVFDLQNTTFDYGGTIFGVPAQDFLSIEYVANGVVSVGMTRYNNPAINGNGLLCKVRLNTYPTLNYPDTNLVFTGTVMAANDSIGTPVTINPTTFQIPYGVSASLMDATSGNFKMLLYPNPVDELLNLLFDKQVLIREIKVLDGIGRVVAVQTPNQRIRSCLLNTADLVNGIYTLQLTTRNVYIYEKFIKAGN
ncbi:MAG: T9SS type A sorting domain-containing protein [Bacteroidetes bacterium]|nr:T9SS type A sorting domain-containing protein [Bacteroidota bacterium]